MVDDDLLGHATASLYVWADGKVLSSILAIPFQH